MPQSKKHPEFQIHPVTGLLDTRSTPDEVPPNGYRYTLNLRVPQMNRLGRMTGWRKAFDKTGYNNADLHDQLSGYTREQIVFGHSARTLAGFSKLFSATKTRIYALNDSTENWEVISDNRTAAVESAAHLENVVVFTNNQDAPGHYFIDQPLIDGQAVADIPDLKRLNVSKAGLVVEFNNVMFYLDLVRDGTRRTNELIWSDYKRPIALYPGGGSLAGRFSLDPGDNILGALPLGDSLFIYTSLKIWEVRAVGLPLVFSFTRRYNPGKPGLRCLAYKNTLVSNGDSHFYWAQDGIYKFDFYDTKPERVEWIHLGSADIFRDLNQDACNAHVGGFNQQRHEIWWSWARGGETVPSQTFVVNTQYPFCSFVDSGFTSFISHNHRKHKSLRDWLKEMCICTVADLAAYGGAFEKEGGFCLGETDPNCPTRPLNFTSGATKVDTDDPTIESEDYLAVPDATSLAALLASVTEESICEDELVEGKCGGTAAFVMVSAHDNTLKEDCECYYRETCVGFTGCGTYEKRGYRSLARSGALSLGKPGDDKELVRMAAEIHAEPSSVPAQFILRIGIASQAADPNSASGRCVILWSEEEPRDIDCLSDVDAARHIAENTRPSDQFEFGLYQVGRYLYYEFEIVNKKVTPEDTGGACSISRFTFNAALLTRPL